MEYLFSTLFMLMQQELSGTLSKVSDMVTYIISVFQSIQSSAMYGDKG